MKKVKENTIKIFKALTTPKNKLSLIPNWLSFGRAIGGFAIPIMAYLKAPIIAMATVLGTVAISDFLDGPAARLIAKEETEEGALLDAVSDKIFSLSLIAGIIAVSPIFIINGILESIIAVINAKSFEENKTPKSNLVGKLKIWPLSVALVSGYLGFILNGESFLSIKDSTYTSISIISSLITVPFEIINIKQYYDESKKEKIEEKISKPHLTHTTQIQKEIPNENLPIKQKVLKKRMTR